MYFHLLYSPDFFSDVSWRKSTRKLFCEATKLMNTIDHELVANSMSPSLVFLSCPFHIGVSLTLGKRFRSDNFGDNVSSFLPTWSSTPSSPDITPCVAPFTLAYHLHCKSVSKG